MIDIAKLHNVEYLRVATTTIVLQFFVFSSISDGVMQINSKGRLKERPKQHIAYYVSKAPMSQYRVSQQYRVTQITYNKSLNGLTGDFIY